MELNWNAQTKTLRLGWVWIFSGTAQGSLSYMLAAVKDCKDISHAGRNLTFKATCTVRNVGFAYGKNYIPGDIRITCNNMLLSHVAISQKQSTMSCILTF